MFGETRTCNFVKQEYVPWCLVIQEYVNVIWCLVKKRACLLVSDEVRTFNLCLAQQEHATWCLKQEHLTLCLV